MWGHGGAYQTWTQFLRDWAGNGAGATTEAAARLPALRPEDYPPHTWARFAEQLTTALDLRLRAWGRSLNAALAAARDEFDVGRALVQARTGLDAVRALAAHPGLPDALREQVSELVEKHVRTFRNQLEDQLDREARAGADPGVIEARRRTVRENPLTTPGRGGDEPAGQPRSGRRRPGARRRDDPDGPGPDGTGPDRPARAEGWAYDPAAPARRRIITD
ncbi:hypothetical protein ACGFXC_03620 [Streptomyces sp. NPDC048507]|uniref:hypothetical protein n=1 Tax=Streptomyces sp. NPDC048507 TaxID=3365560 RepID=UPI003718FE47